MPRNLAHLALEICSKNTSPHTIGLKSKGLDVRESWRVMGSQVSPLLEDWHAMLITQTQQRGISLKGDLITLGMCQRERGLNFSLEEKG